MYCAFRYLYYNLLYGLISALIIMLIFFIYPPHTIIAITLFLVMCYFIHKISIDKVLIHSYKKFSFDTPFEKISHKNAILTFLLVLFLQILFSAIAMNQPVSNTFFLLFFTFGTAFISVLIPIWFYINKKTTVTEL